MFSGLAAAAAQEVFIERAGNVIWHSELAATTHVSFALSRSWAPRPKTPPLYIQAAREGFVRDINLQALRLLDREIGEQLRARAEVRTDANALPQFEVSDDHFQSPVVLMLSFGQDVEPESALARIDLGLAASSPRASYLARLASDVYRFGIGLRPSTLFEFLASDAEAICRDALQRKSRADLLRGLRLLLVLVRAHLASATRLGARMGAEDVARERQLIVGELPVASAVPQVVTRLIRFAAQNGDEDGLRHCATVPITAMRLALEHEDHLVFDAFVSVLPSVFRAVREEGALPLGGREALLRWAVRGMRDNAILLGDRVSSVSLSLSALSRAEEAWSRLQDAIVEVLRGFISGRDAGSLEACLAVHQFVSGTRLLGELERSRVHEPTNISSSSAETVIDDLAPHSMRVDALSRITLRWDTNMLALLGWLDYTDPGTRPEPAATSEPAPSAPAEPIELCASAILRSFSRKSAQAVVDAHLAAARRDNEERVTWDGWMLEGRDELVAYSIDFMPHLERATAVRLLVTAELDERTSAAAIGIDEGGRHYLEQLRSSVQHLQGGADLGWINLHVRIGDLAARIAQAAEFLTRVIDGQRTLQADMERDSAIPGHIERDCQRLLSDLVPKASTAIALYEEARALSRRPCEVPMPAGSLYVASLIEKRWVIGSNSERWNVDRTEASAKSLAEGIDRRLVEVLRESATAWPGTNVASLLAACVSAGNQGKEQVVIICCDPLGLGAQLWHAPEVVRGDVGSSSETPGLRAVIRIGSSPVRLFDVYPADRGTGFTLVVPLSALDELVMSEWSHADPDETVVAGCKIVDLAKDTQRRKAVLEQKAQVRPEPNETLDLALSRFATWQAWVHFELRLRAESGVLVLSGDHYS